LVAAEAASTQSLQFGDAKRLQRGILPLNRKKRIVMPSVVKSAMMKARLAAFRQGEAE
jgi:hypothetical protein